MCENQEKNGIVQYLMLTFLIAWGIEAVIIAGERFEILTGVIGSTLIFLLIGLGAGFAPAYAVCILLKKQRKIHGLKDILRLTLQPVMIIGGGIEEFGWRGFLQPQMEKKFPFAISALIVGVIWGCWHLPLWLVQTSNQSSMHFLSFLCYCITFSFVLGLLYRLTRSTLACIMLHAWGNTLQSMFTRSTLIDPVSVKTAAIWGTEILIVILVSFLIDRLQKVENSYE
ncbi:CPBP family intramembrane glutamic endopeptidase [Ruminiclostridium cellobioparum]|uniref:CPBP family intramembrane glutamic endopeptidase n=1 Tax=Ruminiclostridium cellobioparum TaxID=29355 RepID=UPI0004847CC5|nr:CPBP family intramembrane glutamic endopeptidase [Ruminiclostridium cellobioparum]